jgi:hypothetical protein
MYQTGILLVDVKQHLNVAFGVFARLNMGGSMREEDVRQS